MPTYEYKCDNCQYLFEKFQSINAKALKKCPQCGKMKLVRLIGTGAGIIFKGSGFYQTDYRDKSYTKQADKEKNSQKKAVSETKKDTKTKQKKDSKPKPKAKK